MKIHHIGYLVKDINEAIGKFSVLGFMQEGDIAFDSKRKIYICFMTNDGYRIELISPTDESSVVYNTLKKIGNSPYHICYRTNDIDKELVRLSANGFKQIDEPAAAPAIEGKKVVFMYNTKIGIIELVEEV